MSAEVNDRDPWPGWGGALVGMGVVGVGRARVRALRGSLVQSGALRFQLVDEEPPHLHYEDFGFLVQYLRCIILLL